MATATTPEAEPKAPKEKEDKKKEEPKKEEPKKEEPKKEVPPEPEPEPENGDEERHHFDARLTSMMYHTVRKPLGKLLLTGAVLASPVVAGATWLGDKIARNTIGKVPVAGSMYNVPRRIITSTAGKVCDVLAGTAAGLTALPVDLTLEAGHGVGRGLGIIKGNLDEKKYTRRGMAALGRGLGKGLEKGGAKTMEGLHYAGQKGKEATKYTIEKTIHFLVNTAKMPFKAVRYVLTETIKGVAGQALAIPLAGAASVAALAGVTFYAASITGQTAWWWWAVEKMWAPIKAMWPW